MPCISRFTRWLASTALASALAFASPTQASIPVGGLDFIQRTGTVSASDDIEVWLRYTLDSQSSGLHFHSTPTFGGIDPADLPSGGTRWNPATRQFEDVPFQPGSIYSATLEPWLGCQGNFVASDCGPAAYSYTWGGWPSLAHDLDLDPGESLDILLLTFHPVGGAAAAGTYRLPIAGLQLRFSGFDTSGQALDAYWGLGATCQTGGPIDACAFTRVVAQTVPEPATWMLAAPLLAWFGRRRIQT